MALPTARTMARARALVNSTLADRATNARTGLTVDCRVSDTRRDEPVRGLPSFVRFRRWLITMPDGSDATSGDRVTVASKGTYYVIDTGSPTTVSVSTDAYCVMLRDEAGNVGFPTNFLVTLTCATNNSLRLTNVPVLIYAASHDAELTPVALRFEWAVWIDPTLTYDGTTKIQPLDFITWPHDDRPQQLFEKRPVIGAVDAMCWYFKSISDGSR